ncbi:MAG: MFS transporter [bacterium]
MTAGSREGAATSRRTLITTLAVVSVSQALLLMDTTVVAMAAPAIGRDLAAGIDGLAWIPNAYLMALAGTIPLWGGLGDRWGRWRSFAAGLALFAAGSLVAALAPAVEVLVLGRTLQGIGAAAVFALGMSLLTAVFPADRLGSAMGTWMAVVGVGMCLGPPLGALVQDEFSWRGMFVINIVVVLVLLAVGWRAVPESRDPQRLSADATGGLLFAGAIVAVVTALHLAEGALLGAGAAPALALFLVTGILAAGVVIRERRARFPVMPPAFFADRVYRSVLIAATLVSFAHLGVLYLQTFHLQSTRGWSPLETGLILLPLSVGIVVGGAVSAPLARRYGERATATACLLILLGGMALLVLLGWGLPSWAIACANLLVGFGSGVALPCMSSVAMLAIPRRQAGVASATLNTARQAGAALGIGVLLLTVTAISLLLSPRGIGVPDAPLRGTAAAPLGRTLWSAVTEAAPYSDALALGAAYGLSALAVLVATLLAWRGIPARTRRPESTPA